MPNQGYETELFREQLAAIRDADKPTADRIERVVERIISNPASHDGMLKGPRSGQCKKRAVDEKYRIGVVPWAETSS